jgi:opacity protein-like surface antigen
VRPAGLALAVTAALLAAAAPASAQPDWWVALGGQAGIETSRLGDTAGTEGGGWVALGWHLFRLGPVLLGPEGEASGGRLTADLGTRHDDVTVWRGRVGVRAAWWGDEDDDPRLVPYLRGGGVYRADSGRFVDDDGVGWYAGIGLDVRLSEHWAVGPFATYEAVSLSIETGTVLVGLGVSFSY